MRVTRINNYEQLHPYLADWHRLAAGSPFVDSDWVSTWWSHYGHADDLYVLIVQDDNENVVAIAPWFLETSVTKGRRIKCLGAGEVCTDYTQVMVADCDRQVVMRTLATWLQAANSQNTVDSWDFLWLEGSRADDLGLLCLRQELKRLDYEFTDMPIGSCWQVATDCTWEEYVTRLGNKSRRRKVRTALRRYIETDRAKFEYARSESQVAEFFDSFVELHQGRRNTKGDAGCFSSIRFGKFLRNVTDVLFDQDKLLLSRLMIDDVPAACSFGLLTNGVHYMYQAGMNQDLHKHNPGWLMNTCSIRYAIENGITAIDYLRGDEPYKQKLGAEPIELMKFRVTANQAQARLRDKVSRLQRTLKDSGRVLKSSLQDLVLQSPDKTILPELPAGETPRA